MASVARAVSQPAAPAAVRVESLRRGFDGRTVLTGIDIAIARGEFVALLGRSGSGKSTILRAVAGLDVEAGVEGTGTIEVPARRAVLFQDSRLLPWARVIDNVALGSYGPGSWRRAKAALGEVGLAGYERKWPKTLSGGEQQRVALARSLVREPELILADEPFSALDALTRLRMQRLLLQLCERHGPAVLFVTHDVEEALRLADRVIIIADGRIVHDRSTSGVRDSAARFSAARDEILARLGVSLD
ncbi:MAG: transporter ATP-binding protein [Xanthobacteraceae bacterium]|nr:transporter ATP-binding protein [Xanthobacteraceae bacterium]